MYIAEAPREADETAARGLAVLARSYKAGMQLGLHAHREAQLAYAVRGVMQIATPKGRWLVPPDRAVWLPPRLEHAIDMLADVEMRTLYVGADRLACHPEAPRLGREFVVRVGALLRELVLALFAVEIGCERRALLARLALFELAEAKDGATFMPMPSDPRARRVAETILAHPNGVHDLDRLAEEVGASRRTLTRLFPADTSLTFRAWRQRARVMAAVEILGGGRASIKETALRLGFSSTAAFGHAFRQVVGTTPSDFLRRS